SAASPKFRRDTFE
ncbi:hypothetical protein CLOP_g14518, partial [Closterium sp. NIES-67]